MQGNEDVKSKGSWVLRVPWWLLLVVELVTRGFFDMIWLLVLTSWVKKVRGASTAYLWAKLYALTFPAWMMMSVAVLAMTAVVGGDEQASLAWCGPALVAGLLVTRIFALFTLRQELAAEPIGLRTGYWRTILFGTIYLQYCLQGFAKRMRGGDDGVADAGLVPNELGGSL
jgi:hypothetical protein